MRSVSLTVNGVSHELELEPRELLVYVLRERLGLTGTVVGCDTSSCGACTVLLDGESVKSCTVLGVQADGRAITTIEALGSAAEPHPLQTAWALHQVPQCGYCQSGMLMAAAALLATNRAPSDADIDAAITNICRCGTYPRIHAAIHAAALELQHGASAA